MCAEDVNNVIHHPVNTGSRVHHHSQESTYRDCSDSDSDTSDGVASATNVQCGVMVWCDGVVLMVWCDADGVV